MSTAHQLGTPRFSVVINTFNRADVLPRAIHSVLRQSLSDLELIVVDDGSTDNTSDVLAAIDDPRIRCVAQPNQGFSAARNRGVDLATSDWVTFLDDDDVALPDWLATLDAPRNADRCALVCCGADVVDGDGNVVERLRPDDTGPMFDDAVALFLAGTFAVRHTVFLAVGGFAEPLECSQHTELFLRLIPYCVAHHLELVSTDSPGIRINRRANTDRSSITPQRLVRGGAYVLEHHYERLARSREFLANWYSVMGVSAARLRDHSSARRYLARAARAEPFALKRWARLGLALVPTMGSRVWRSDDYSGRETAPLAN